MLIRPHRGLTWALLLLLTGGCSLPGTAPAAPPLPVSHYVPEPAPRPGGSVTFADSHYPSDLDPISDSEVTSRRIQVAIYAGLQYPDDQLNWVPDLALDIPTRENGLVRDQPGGGMLVTYILRHNLRWSDGVAITAQDVVTTWQMAASAAGAGMPGYEGYLLITGIDVGDDRHLTIHFSRAYGPYLTLFQHNIVPGHALSGLNLPLNAVNPFWLKPTATSGPFRVDDVQPSTTITLSRNPQYAAGEGRHPAQLDHLVFRAFPDRSSMLEAVGAGRVQLAGDLFERDLDALAAVPGRLTAASALAYGQLTFNQADPNPLTGHSPPWRGDARLLRDLRLALDVPALVATATRGRARPAPGPILPQVPVMGAGLASPRGGDPAAAGRDLDLDGWTRGSDGIRARNGTRLQFALSTFEGNPVQAALESGIAAAWRTLGVDVQVRTVPAGDYLGDWSSAGQVAHGRYEAGMWVWDLTPDPASAAAFLASSQIPTEANGGAGSNFGRISDPRLDAALRDGAATLDLGRRKTAYARVHTALIASGATIPLYQRLTIDASVAGFHNLRPSPDLWSTDTWNSADWWVG